MNRRLILSLALAATALVAGCASGPKFAEVSQSMPKLKDGEGRVAIAGVVVHHRSPGVETAASVSR